MTQPRILIVDDEENVRKALFRWFSASGFEVDLANDGASAVNLCRVNKYDVVTMDYEMPRMNGREAIRAIKEDQPALPIVILTGYFDTGMETLDYEACQVLYKPVSMRELEDEVRRLMGSAEDSA